MHMALRDRAIEALPRGALLGDEPVLEETFHAMSHRRIAVEPTEDVFGGHVVHDLMIELLPDVEGEAGDLTFSCGHIGRAHAVNRMEVEKKVPRERLNA